jgi:large subunit ribosomal protein L7/L12
MAEVATEEQNEQAQTEEKQFSPKVNEVIDKVSEFTLMELSELVEAFEDRFNVRASAMAAPMAMAGSVAAGGGDEEESEEPVAFDVVLEGFGDNKIQVIKAVRSVTDLALKEAKQVVEGAPSTIKEGISKDDADECCKAIEEAGGKATVKPSEG